MSHINFTSVNESQPVYCDFFSHCFEEVEPFVRNAKENKELKFLQEAGKLA